MLTGHKGLLDQARRWSLHGMNRDAWQRYGANGSWFYDVDCPGYKYNMTDIQAALGLHQLNKLAQFHARRSAIVRLAALAVLVLTASCKRSTGAHGAPPAPAAPAPSPGVQVAGRIVLDIARDLDACTLGHRGVLLDFGDPSMRAALRSGPGVRLLARTQDEDIEYEGATWLRVRSRSLAASFYS